MEEWKECKLKDICYFSKDRINVSELNNETYISTENMIPNRGGITSAATLPTNEQTPSFVEGDILVSNIRPYFKKIWKARYTGGCSADVLNFKTKENISKEYLYYVLSDDEFFKYCMITSKGTKMPRGDKVAIMEYPIHLPPFPTQQKIAAILSSLDDKIEQNNKINENLEQQAQAIFKNWFVDFEPFGIEERIESPIGTMIPRSLRMVQVADIPHLLETGKRPKGGAVSEGVPSIGAENVKQLGVFDFSSNKFIPREYADALGKGKINGYELLLYKDGGKPGTFIPHFSMFGEGFPYDECYINEHVFKLDFYDKGLNEFAYFYFNTEYVKNWLANNGGKAAIPGINQNDVNAIWIYDLENSKVKEFAKFVEPLFKKIFSNCKQNRELSTIRDTLLPKLMNGEIGI